MKKEKGSILVGVLAIGLVLTYSALNLLVTVGYSGSADAEDYERQSLRNAAESGLRMGLRWAKAYDASGSGQKINDENWPATAGDFTITPGEWLTDFVTGFEVKVVLRKKGGEVIGKHAIQAFARRGEGKETLGLLIQIDYAAIGGAPPARSILSIHSWNQTVQPAVSP